MTKEKKFVANLEDLQILIGREVHHGETEIAIFRLSDNRVRAIGNRCPHKNGPLAEGTVSGEYVFCPLHDYKVSLIDGHVQEPDDGCVNTYETVVEDGKVYVMV